MKLHSWRNLEQSLELTRMAARLLDSHPDRGEQP